MIQKVIYTAAFLLAIQVCLVVVLSGSKSGLEAETPGKFFTDYDKTKVSRIEISDDSGETITLAKKDSSWVLDSSFSAAADDNQVTAILDKLGTVKRGMPIATTKGSAERFKTAESGFERHLVVGQGDTTVVDVYLGSSSGFRHSHIREAGKESIFSVPLSSYELSANSKDWIDKNLVKLDKEKLKKIDLNSMVLEKQEDGWQLTEPNGVDVDTEQIEQLLNSIADISVEDVYDAEQVAKLFTDNAGKSFTVTLSDEESVTYSLVQKEDNYVLKISTRDHYFKVMSFQVKDIIEASIDKLAKQQEPELPDQKSETEQN